MKFILPVSLINLLLLSSLFLPLNFSKVWAQATPNDHVPGQILVKFKDNTPAGVANAELKKHQGQVKDQIQGIGVLVVNVPEKTEAKVLAALSKNPHVEYAESDGVATTFLYPATSPDDPDYALKQWGLENTGQTIVSKLGVVDADIDAQAAWGVTTGAGVKVAILDTGIDQDHPDLSSKVVQNQDFTGSGSVDDFYGHGTHVGGIVAALTNNTTGVSGVCPDCVLMNGKVLNNSGSGAYSWIANGITWASNNGARVINLSLGGTLKSYTLESAVNYAWNHSVVVVAAAGNSGNRSKTYPAAYTNAIAVAATTNQDKKASFSNYNDSWVDVAAPGENIYSTFPNHPYTIGTNYGKSLNYDYASGTSMATPMTAGTAALIWSTPYGTSASSVRNRLQQEADEISGTGSLWDYGRINAAASVAP
jgi:thermitase